jgi:hypothetical protein
MITIMIFNKMVHMYTVKELVRPELHIDASIHFADPSHRAPPSRWTFLHL